MRHADRIFVLDHGVLIESGDHHALMAAQGRYAELFTLLQASGYQSSEQSVPVPSTPIQNEQDSPRDGK